MHVLNSVYICGHNLTDCATGSQSNRLCYWIRRDILTFEEKLDKLKEIVEKLETPDTLALETSLELFEEGVTLVRSCRDLLQKAELRIQKVSEAGNDNDEIVSILTASEDGQEQI